MKKIILSLVVVFIALLGIACVSAADADNSTGYYRCGSDNCPYTPHAINLSADADNNPVYNRCGSDDINFTPQAINLSADADNDPVLYRCGSDDINFTPQFAHISAEVGPDIYNQIPLKKLSGIYTEYTDGFTEITFDSHKYDGCKIVVSIAKENFNDQMFRHNFRHNEYEKVFKIENGTCNFNFNFNLTSLKPGKYIKEVYLVTNKVVTNKEFIWEHRILIYSDSIEICLLKTTA